MKISAATLELFSLCQNILQRVVAFAMLINENVQGTHRSLSSCRLASLASYVVLFHTDTMQAYVPLSRYAVRRSFNFPPLSIAQILMYSLQLSELRRRTEALWTGRKHPSFENGSKEYSMLRRSIVWRSTAGQSRHTKHTHHQYRIFPKPLNQMGAPVFIVNNKMVDPNLPTCIIQSGAMRIYVRYRN